MLSRWNRGRVNPLAPLAIVLAGLVWIAGGHALVGGGIAVGAALAYINGLVLSRRVDLAAMSGNMAAAMMVMQLGLLVMLTVIGITTIILVKISIAMGVAAAAGFAAAHLAILASYYWAHGRDNFVAETKAR